jgi:hypothetical protein
LGRIETKRRRSREAFCFMQFIFGMFPEIALGGALAMTYNERKI